MGTAEIRIAERIAWLLERHFGRYGEIREVEGSGDRLFITDYASERQLVSWVLGLGENAWVLAPAQLGDLGPGGAAVRAPGVAVGDDAVGHLATLRRPACRAARAAEVAVVGMGDDNEDALSGVVLGHGRRW